MQIKIEAVLHRRAIHFRNQPAGALKGVAIETDAVPDLDQLVRGLARMPAPPPANVKSEFRLQRLQASLQRTDDAGGDTGGMPIHAHDGAEGLEPERMRQAAQELVPPIMHNDGLTDNSTKLRHPVGQPFRHMPAMQGQVRAACPSCHSANLKH